MTKNRRVGCILISLLVGGVLLLLIIVGGSLIYTQRVRLINSRPLVLIFNPVNHEYIAPGETIMVSANARTKAGVQRMELWIDGHFVYAQESAPGEDPLPAETFMVPWTPIGPGKHTILVRAYSADGVDGQASVNVHIDESLEEAQPSEPSDSQDVPPGELADALIGGPAPGGSGNGGPSGGAPAPPAHEQAPAPSDAPPGSLEDITEDLGILSDDAGAALSEEPIGVRVEALAMHTSGSYENLHCYVGAGHLSPQWYPDEDRDQTTDETFLSLGGGEWDVVSHLGGSNAPIFMWPGNEPIPLDLTCVGVYGGGAEADELGLVNISAPPETWDGNIRRTTSSGGEGSFTLDYRFSLDDPGGMGFPAILDPSIPPPTNLRITDANQLQWDWEPVTDPEPETPPDGFYIYLNGSRQFTIDSLDTRSISLPPEWSLPPCGIDYIYTATAWRLNPDDPTDNFESYHSEPLSISRNELEECDIRGYVSFETLSVTGLDAYPDEGRTDQVGPLLVGINACSAGYCFNYFSEGRCDPYAEDCGGLRLAPDFPHSLAEIMLISGHPNHDLVPVTAEGVTIGYVVWNQNSTGTELWCEGAIHVPGEEIYNPESEVLEYHSTLDSRTPDARCNVAFSISSELITSDYTGIEFPPLPSLYIDEIRVNETSGIYSVNVRNSNTATWSGYDLEVLLTRNSGDEITRFVVPDLVLEPATDFWIRDDSMPAIERPLDLCVSLDPNNTVLESVERTNPGWQAPPTCIDIPDLAITGVGFDDDDRTLIVTLQNRGSGPLRVPAIDIDVFNRSSGGITQSFTHPLGIPDLRPWESVVVPIVLLENPLRTYGLRTNYTVTVDPQDSIVELDEDNNSFDLVAGADTFELWWDGFDFSDYDLTTGGYTWTGLYLPWYDVEDSHNYDRFYASAFIDNGITRRPLGDLTVDCVVARGQRTRSHTWGCQDDDPSPDSLTFQLANGEGVAVEIRGYVKPERDADLWQRLGSFWLYFDPSNGGGWCDDRHQPFGDREWGYVYPPDTSFGPNPWYAAFTLCRVGD